MAAGKALNDAIEKIGWLKQITLLRNHKKDGAV